MAAEDRPDPASERDHYGHHQNDPGDARYRAFLGRLAAPLVERLQPGARGLDYGSGPGPTLSLMLEERGFPTAIYDPFFAPNREVLDRTYDFVSCTETAEHFFIPRLEFDRFARLLRAGGILAIMTEWIPADLRIEQWRYARDPTHVCFYDPHTLQWIARRYGWSVELPERNVAVFSIPPAMKPGA